MFRLKSLFVLLLAVAITPAMTWGAAIIDVADEEPKQPIIVKLKPGDGPHAVSKRIRIDGPDGVVKRAIGPNGEVAVFALGHSDEDEEDPNIKPGGPWIGIQFGPVPAALSKHLRLEEGVGQMVLNVAENSPADQAGIEQYDVIISVDGDGTPSDMVEFLDVVRSFEQGERHEFSIIRGGNTIKIDLSVGVRPDEVSGMKFKFEGLHEQLSEGSFFRRGGMITKDDDGNWTFNRLDDLDELHNIWQHIPQLDGKDFKFEWKGLHPDDGHSFNMFFSDKKNVTINKGEDGKVTVSRTETENGKEVTTTSTYDSMEDFKAQDPETYKSTMRDYHVFDFGQAGNATAFAFPGGGMAKFHAKLDDDMNEVLKECEIIIKKAEGDAAEAMKNLHIDLGKLRGGDFLHPHSGKIKGMFLSSKASTSITIDGDGTVIITTRKGEDELIEKFDSVSDLKKANPEMYEKYQGLLEARDAE